MAPAPNDVSPPPPPPPPPTPTRRNSSRRSHHHKKLANLFSKVFSSPSTSNNRPEKLGGGGGGSTPDHANNGANAETESDSAYRDLGMDPDRLTVFNVARDCGKSRTTKDTAPFSNPAAATTSAELPLPSSLPGGDVSGGDGGDDGGRWDNEVPPPPQDTTSLPPSSSLGHHYPPRRSWRWTSKRNNPRPPPQLPPTPATPPFSQLVEDPVIDDGTNENNTSGKVGSVGKRSSSRNKARKKWKGKGKMSSSSDGPDQTTTSPLPMIEATSSSSSSSQPPTPPPKPNQHPPPAPPKLKPKLRTVSEVLQARERVRLERRSLKASGDWLGVQGADPWTGEVDVLTPTNTVSSSSGGGGSLPGNNSSSVVSNGEGNGAAAPFDVRGLLGSIVGRRRAAERARDRAREMEVRSRERVREARDRAKLEKIERMKVEEGWRIKREMMLGGAAEQHQPTPRRWRQHRDQWSSIAEPNLSPIAQSVSSSPTNVDEPPSSGTLSKTMPNYSWPIKSPEMPEVLQNEKTTPTITPEAQQRSHSTDTIIHNMKNRTSGYEPQNSTAEKSSIVRNISLPERIQDPGPSNQTRPHQEGKHFLWRRRRRMTDPGGHDSRSPVAESITPPAKASTSQPQTQTQEAERGSPENHFTGLVIPDYHLHFLTPEPGEKPRTPLSRTGEATTPLPLRTLEVGLDKGKAVEHRIQIINHNSDHHSANEATATSYPSKSKGLMKRHSVHRRVIPIKSSADCLLANGKSMKTSVHIPLTHSRSLDTQWSYKKEQERLKRNGTDPQDQDLTRASSSRIDDARRVITDPPPNTTNVVEVGDMEDAMTHLQGDELPLQELEDVSDEPQSMNSRPPGPSAITTGGRRFAFIPTITTTGSARSPSTGRDPSPPEEGRGRERERKVPTPPPWALGAFRNIDNSDGDLANRTSSSPSPTPPPQEMLATMMTKTATTTTPVTEESARLSDEAPKTSPELRRNSRLIPPRSSSLSSAGPGASEMEMETDLKVEKTRGTGKRGIGTMYSPFPPSIRRATNTNTNTSRVSDVVTRSVSLPMTKKKAAVHFSEEGLAKAKLEKEEFDKERRAYTELDPEPELETVVARKLTFHMVPPPPLGTSRRVQQQHLPEGRGRENDTVSVVNAYGETNGDAKGKQVITKTKFIPLSPANDPNALATMGGVVDNIATTPLSIHMARLPVRTQLLSEHMEDMVREAARTAAATTRRRDDRDQQAETAAAAEESMNRGESSTRSRSMGSRPEAMMSMLADGDDIQRTDHACKNHQQCGDKTVKPEKPVTVRKEDVNPTSCPNEGEGEVGVKEEIEELQHLKRELLKRIEDDIQRQKQERLALPLAPLQPPAPTYPPPLPPPDRKETQQKQQQQKPLTLPRHQQEAGGLLLMGLMSQDNDKYHTLPRPLKPARDHHQAQQRGSSDCPPRPTTNPLLPETIARQQQQEVKSDLRVGPQPQILVPQQQQVQQTLHREGGPEGGADTDALSKPQTPRLPRTDNGNSSSSSSSSSNTCGDGGIQPAHSRQAVSADATAAGITAVRQAETLTQGLGSAHVVTTTSVIATASTITKSPPRANRVTKVTFLHDAATPLTITGTETENTSKKNNNMDYGRSSTDPLLTPTVDFLKAMCLLVYVIATAWFLVACMALDLNSGFWRRRRAMRSSMDDSGSAYADVPVFVLAGLFCVVVIVLARYVAVVLAWVGVF